MSLTVKAESAPLGRSWNTVDHPAPTREDLASVFGRLQSLLISLDNIETFLQQVTELASLVVEPPVSCGITVRQDGQPLTVASTDARAEALDETQYATSEGPCLHALRTGETVNIPDMDKEVRWPEYGGAAIEQGLRCSLSLPLTVQGATLGAMNVYAFHDKNAFTPEQRQRCEVFAAQASGALQLAAWRTRDAELRDQLEQALTSRTVIDQALGILMGQQQCTVEEAFALLRMRSQGSNQKLRDVAADLVTRVTGQAAGSARPFDAS